MLGLWLSLAPTQSVWTFPAADPFGPFPPLGFSISPTQSVTFHAADPRGQKKHRQRESSGRFLLAPGLLALLLGTAGCAAPGSPAEERFKRPSPVSGGLTTGNGGKRHCGCFCFTLVGPGFCVFCFLGFCAILEGCKNTAGATIPRASAPVKSQHYAFGFPPNKMGYSPNL